MMHKLLLVSIVILFAADLSAQNSSPSGIGKASIVAGKNTVISPANNNVINISGSVVPVSDADKNFKNYPGYHTTSESVEASSEINQVVEITAPASGNVDASIESHKEVKVSGNNNFMQEQQKMIDISNSVTQPK